MYPRSNIGDDDDLSAAIPPQQLAAILSPSQRTCDLLGNFSDLDRLFEQLSEPVVIELGNPLPKEKFLPKERVGRCPAAHNEALVGKRRRGSA